MAGGRVTVTGSLGAVAAGHYAATAAGMRILELGGNAVDAGVAAGFALNVVKPDQNGIGGEAPILIHEARTGRSVAISGQGWAPARATLAWFTSEGINHIPGDGFLPAMIPATFGSWCTALLAFGTAPLSDVLGPAIDLAESGWGVHEALSREITTFAPRFREEWLTSAAVCLPGGEPPPPGSLLRNPEWARALRGCVDASLRAGRSGDREQSIRAALDHFYAGPIAETAVGFQARFASLDATGRAHHGLHSLEDWADYGRRGTRIEEPLRTTYRGVEVLKCGSWSQGPVLLQQLRLLEGFDLAGLGHNAPAYLHVLLEAAKLAFADRNRWYGDPVFANVPMDALLSEEYAAARRTLIDPDVARHGAAAGDPAAALSAAASAGAVSRGSASDGEPPMGRWPVRPSDTTHVDVVDRAGNLFSATPSGGWLSTSPMIEGLGFPLGTRGQMFSLTDGHPNALAPGKRPRTTLTPSLALRSGRPWLAFGTPGGDQQDQWLLQFLLNVVEFGMTLQEALDAPTVHSADFPSSFYPGAAFPGRAHAEGRIPEAVIEELRARGHEIVVDNPWSHGQPTAVSFEPRTGAASAGATQRGQVATALAR